MSSTYLINKDAIRRIERTVTCVTDKVTAIITIVLM